MAGFDFGALLQDPQVALGLSLLGASSPRNAGLQQSAQLLGALNQQKQMADYRKQQMSLEQARSERENAQTDLMRQKLKQEQLQQERQQAFLRSMAPQFLQQFGIDMGGLLGTPSSSQGVEPPPTPVAPAMPAPQGPAQAAPVAPQAPAIGEPLPPASQAIPMPSGPQQTPAGGQPAQESFFRKVLMPIESGGRHFNPDGSVLTSKKGAVGVAQVMPSTGPEAARLAGLPWDENRFRNDPAYNAALGDAYTNEQLRTFQDPLQAAAAYNAGPGAVKRAVAFAEKSGKPEMWASLLPAETQAYVQKVAQATGTSVSPAPDQTPKMPTDAAGLDKALRSQQGLATLGAIMQLAGVPEGRAISELAKAQTPQKYAPGDIVVTPNGTFNIPNPHQQFQENAQVMQIQQGNQRINMEAQRLRDEQQQRQFSNTLAMNAEGRAQKGETRAEETHASQIAKDQRQATKEDLAAAQSKAKDQGLIINNVRSSSLMVDKVDELMNSPGLEQITGRKGWIPLGEKAGTFWNAITSDAQRNAGAQLATLKAQVFKDVINSMKELSKTGSTGMGSNLSNTEGQQLRDSLAALDRAQTYQQFKEQLGVVRKYTNEMRNQSLEGYEKTYKESPLDGMPIGTRFLPEKSKNGLPLVVTPDGKKFEVR